MSQLTSPWPPRLQTGVPEPLPEALAPAQRVCLVLQRGGETGTEISVQTPWQVLWGNVASENTNSPWLCNLALF